MAASTFRHFTLCFFCFSLFLAFCSKTNAQGDETGPKLMTEALEWPISMSMLGDLDESDDLDDGLDVDIDGGDEGEMGRRSLFWRRFPYYISYGALSANRIPCPPRSGRSYYTHNCFRARAPVNPYSRGCSRITRCRR